jgi:hypothetical protein
MDLANSNPHLPSGIGLEQNTRVFEAAIDKLKQTISSTDAAVFQATLVEDVWKAAEEIQESQRRRKSLRNMRRVEPFLKGLEKYSKVIEVACNGTPYLPWIWASDFRPPVMLFADFFGGSHQAHASGKRDHMTETLLC